MKDDLSKDHLYESVKQIIDIEEKPTIHLHLHQHKLYTLFSIAFNYFLFNSTKNPGTYIIRVDGPILAEKLAKKAKDQASRKFMESLLMPKKLIYKGSTFYLDFFQIGSWNRTKDLNKEKIKGALIIKNTARKPLEDKTDGKQPEDDAAPSIPDQVINDIPKDFYISSLTEFVPKVLLVAYEEEFEGFEKISFPFIKKEKEPLLKGVTIASDVVME
tara:strand:- start:47 stop:694 length:648 start_codon:yes stop_codon:yes gene_type:complete